MNDGLKLINLVANKIETEWKKFDYSIESFPNVVLQHTNDIDLSEFGNLVNIAELIQNPNVAIIQAPSSFSDLYIKLFDNGRFWVEVLNWWGLDINIHDHDFSGVQFQLRGKSLNVVYDFDEMKKDNRLFLGKIRVKRAELWNERDRSIVLPGSIEPHNVYHLSIPTVSLLFRTHPNPMYGPQMNYFPPFIKADYSVATALLRKKIALLRLLSRGETEEFHKAFNKIIANQTKCENLFTFIKMVDILFQNQHISLLQDYVSKGDEVEEQIIRSAAYFKGNLFLSAAIKNIKEITEEEKILVSILAASFDNATLSDILQHLSERKINVNFDDLLISIRGKLSINEKNQLNKILELCKKENVLLH